MTSSCNKRVCFTREMKKDIRGRDLFSMIVSFFGRIMG